ncbi:MAG: class I tRNA ligase family protein, partial [Prevotellaceae bacterium]|nr:class I tRNA ligase family protein [Prevotellaceae bacterium]
PGIHHVMARAIKDIFCRYKTQKGFLVNRRAGWDTHGLPVELSVEKMLGITKEDIGKKVSVDEYNAACRREVMKYTREWENLTEQMGYWVDMEHPYITYDNRYIETLWFLLKRIYSKNLLYKGYTIQPYSPAAGTGLSTHELNQPGCYRDTKDTSCVAMFRMSIADNTAGVKNYEQLRQIFGEQILSSITKSHKVGMLAWTTTPWTLPSNTALCVGPNIKYVAVESFNPYSGKKITVILAKDLVSKHFNPKAAELSLDNYKEGDKLVPYKIVGECTGKQLLGLKYKQLIPWINPGKDAFRVISGDYVTTEDGTGIVHIAPTFGADDDRVAKENGVPPLMLVDKLGNRQPMVDKTGKFFLVEELDSEFVKNSVNVTLYKEYAGRYVKNEYNPNAKDGAENLDVGICVMLKQQGLAFKIEKYVHSYPHCWRTDKPVLYYPLDSWFIRTTACKDQMVALNKTINWKPESTGTGRFGKWLEDLKDWNLSRSRYWGTPLPIWRTEDSSEEKCIGSMEELMAEIDKSVQAGVMEHNPYAKKGFKVGDFSKENYEKIDLHRPYIDDILLVSDSGMPMKRETDLIDVWFDSGAMPFAQKSLDADFKTDEKNMGSNYGLIKEVEQSRKKEVSVVAQKLWNMLSSDERFRGYKFDKEHLIDEMTVDFVCEERRLIVEIDDNTQNENSVHRTEVLNNLNYRIARYTTKEVLENKEAVLDSIALQLQVLPFGEDLGGAYTADFIAEGVDQTRGWFFTLHAIATMVTGKVAFKNVISNGLVLDKNGLKMSKRLGNGVDPFKVIEDYGADTLRWYMITNSQPWDNLKFDIDGVDEVRRKFFGTLYNTYSFFSLYANVDGFTGKEKQIPVEERPEIDRWIISLLNTLVKEVEESYETYEPTRAGRLIQDFVGDNLSNWYVRLNRKRFWGGVMTPEKLAAYQTLYECLTKVTMLASPIAPFITEKIFCDINSVSKQFKVNSVHLVDFPEWGDRYIDKDLEDKMKLAQQVTSMILALRRKADIKVRQPLSKVVIPIVDKRIFGLFTEEIKSLIKTDTNVKEIDIVTDAAGVVSKKAKANFKILGAKCGKNMKEVASMIAAWEQAEISVVETIGSQKLQLRNGDVVEVATTDVEITTEDIPGSLSLTENGITLALDITITDELRNEGVARELVNRIQNLRKDSGFEVTDRIKIVLQSNPTTDVAVKAFADYIKGQVLGTFLEVADVKDGTEVEMDEFKLKMKIEKV